MNNKKYLLVRKWDNNNNIKCINHIYENQIIAKELYKYDNNNIYKYSHYDITNNSIIRKSIYKNGNIIEENYCDDIITIYIYKNNNLVNSYDNKGNKSEYIYNQRGNLIKDITKTNGIINKYYYIYHKYNNIIEYRVNDKPIICYEYDKYDNLIQKIFYHIFDLITYIINILNYEYELK